MKLRGGHPLLATHHIPGRYLDLLAKETASRTPRRNEKWASKLLQRAKNNYKNIQLETDVAELHSTYLIKNNPSLAQQNAKLPAKEITAQSVIETGKPSLHASVIGKTTLEYKVSRIVAQPEKRILTPGPRQLQRIDHHVQTLEHLLHTATPLVRMQNYLEITQISHQSESARLIVKYMKLENFHKSCLEVPQKTVQILFNNKVLPWKSKGARKYIPRIVFLEDWEQVMANRTNLILDDLQKELDTKRAPSPSAREN